MRREAPEEILGLFFVRASALKNKNTVLVPAELTLCNWSTFHFNVENELAQGASIRALKIQPSPVKIKCNSAKKY